MPQTDHAYSVQRTLKNALHFLIGKGFSALCTAFLLGFIVRFLPVQEYGYYVSAIATLETGFGLSSLGLNWVIVRYTPYFFINSPYKALCRFIINAFILRFLLLFTYAVGLIALTYYFKPVLFLTYRPVIFISAALFITEGLLRQLRLETLESLSNQSFAQIGLLVRQGAFSLLLIGAAFLKVQATLETVLFAELLAAYLALLVATIFIAFAIKPIKYRPFSKTWAKPSFSEMKRIGLNNYFSELISYPYYLQPLTLLIATFETPIHTALFGFTGQLITIMRGYLPSLLLMNVMRPRLFGLYEVSHEFDKPAKEAQLIARVSLLMIFPIVVSIACYGDWLIQLASGNRFNESGFLLLLLTISLIFNIQRLIVTLLINCVKHSAILIRNAIYALITYPIFLYLMSAGHALWFASLAIIWNDIIWCGSSKKLLNAAGYKWSVDLLFILRLALISISCIIFIKWLNLPINLMGFILSGVFITLFFSSYLFFFNPLGEQGKMLKNLAIERFRRPSKTGVHS